MAKIREGFIRIAIITINSASRWREAAPLQIRPVNWQQVSIRFQAVRDFLGHWVIQPQFLQLAISIRTKIKRITPPVKKENWPKLLTTEQIWRKVFSDSRVSWEGLTLNLELFFSRTFRLGTICSSLSITLLDLFSITSYGRIRREEFRKLDHYFDLFLAPLRSHWIWTAQSRTTRIINSFKLSDCLVVFSAAVTQHLSPLRPIYTVRLCRIRQAYDRPTTWIVSSKSNLQSVTIVA